MGPFCVTIRADSSHSFQTYGQRREPAKLRRAQYSHTAQLFHIRKRKNCTGKMVFIRLMLYCIGILQVEIGILYICSLLQSEFGFSLRNFFGKVQQNNGREKLST